MSLFTTAKSADQEVQQLIAQFMQANSVIIAATKAKTANLSLASKHCGKPTYGRKSRRYA
jgi:hypothetical protein